MLDLKSTRWKDLRHAYGEATDIPELLKLLEEKESLMQDIYPNRREDPWHQLWSAICHQYDVYSASYAVLPRLVNISKSRNTEDRITYIHLM